MKFENLTPDLLELLSKENVLFLISNKFRQDFLELRESVDSTYEWDYENTFKGIPLMLGAYDFIIIHPSYRYCKRIEEFLDKYYFYNL